MRNTLVQLLHDSVKKCPNKDAIVIGDQRVTYSMLWKYSCGFANYLFDQGIRKGDKISLLIENSAEYVSCYYGVLMAGAVVVSLNTAAKSRDLCNWVIHSESSRLIVQSNHPELDSLKRQLKSIDISLIHVGNDEFKYKAVSSDVSIPSQLSEYDSKKIAAIIYTSGTTGMPKGVMLSHENLYENIKSIQAYLNLSTEDSIVNVLPFYYSYGNSVLHVHLAVGATLFLENSMLYPHKVMELMSQSKVTGFSGVPSTFNLLLSRVDFDNYDLSSIRYMTQAGGAMAPSQINRILDYFSDIAFFVMYGQTEASARLSYLPPKMLKHKMGSVGIAIPGVELIIMGEDKTEVKEGETGEIYAKGKNIMLGYWKNSDASNEVMYNDYLKTGDLAYKDSEGYIYIVGRSSEMIKSGAHRISPSDIEEVILELSGVEEAAAVGIDNDLLGHSIKVFIVRSPDSELDKMQVMRHCKQCLANYKIPKEVEFINEIPKTASGKVRRFELMD